jgi:ABC-2 type transport system ATP-binding protein
MRGFLRSLAAEGRAVLVSSHLMSELEDTADHLIVIGRGRLLADTSVVDLIAGMSDERVTLRSARAAEVMALLVASGGRVTATDGETLVVTGLDVEEIADLAVASALPLHELSPHRTSLEDAFMELTRDAVEFSSAESKR